MLNPIVNADTSELTDKEAKKIIESLREIYSHSVEDLETASSELESTHKKFESLKQELNKTLDEQERFKELYVSELKKKNDIKDYIFKQKIIKKSQSLLKFKF